MFVNGNGPIPGVLMGFPDVCKTPVGPAVVPMPYPNLAMTPTAVPTQMSVFVMAMPSHNLTTIIPLTEGDEPGVLLGVVSELDMATAECEMGSVNLFIGGPPATKLTSPTGHNGVAPNAPGAVISPSQIVLLSLS